jgi:hypothetical protein
MVYTRKMIVFSNLDDDAVLDLIPMHEIIMIRDMTVIFGADVDDDDSVSNDLQEEDEGENDEAHGADSNKNVLQIETSPEGYNSGRPYQIQAATGQDFRALLEDFTKLSLAAREEAEAKSRFRKLQDKVGKVFNSDFTQRFLAILIFAVSKPQACSVMHLQIPPLTRHVPAQNFFINVSEAQIANSLTGEEAERWGTLFDRLNLTFTCLFTLELLVNMFVHWFSEFWSHGHAPTRSDARL